MTGETLIILALLIPPMGAVLIALTSSRENLRETMTLLTAAALFAVGMTILGRLMRGEQPLTG
ncbi:MAG: monovalent cation/H+ antiporter subunit D family protein, partial [Proteobacteria bacterium]|nr:monovalent cation/H+ antiporter subunit D family protein [Pseudomonadota bacterium]